jgi:hypothetical protein
MLARVFRGKNWKLASEKKWSEEEVRSESVGDRIGITTFDDEEYEIYVFEDGFAALKASKEEAQGAKWIVNAAGGNITRCIFARNEEEALERLKEICTEWKSAGVLYLWKNPKELERVSVWDPKAPPK